MVNVSILALLGGPVLGRICFAHAAIIASCDFVSCHFDSILTDQAAEKDRFRSNVGAASSRECFDSRLEAAPTIEFQSPPTPKLKRLPIPVRGFYFDIGRGRLEASSSLENIAATNLVRRIELRLEERLDA
jgi:hypothetical protein